jgi:digalactosyldiacylglycerol synthase
MRINATHFALGVAAWIVCTSLGYQGGVAKNLLFLSAGNRSRVIDDTKHSNANLNVDVNVDVNVDIAEPTQSSDCDIQQSFGNDTSPATADCAFEERHKHSNEDSATTILLPPEPTSELQSDSEAHPEELDVHTKSSATTTATTTSSSRWAKLKSQGSDIRQRFLDRIALSTTALLTREMDAALDEDSTNNEQQDPTAVTPQSDLTLPQRHLCVVTTAALPWMTGTAVNPLLRAAHLCRTTKLVNNGQGGWVSLVIPWLELQEDRDELYGATNFQTPAEQEMYIRNWLRDEADMADVADDIKLVFYPARYHSGLKSIFAMGDILSLIPNRDVCVLEEPEHLNWYRAPGTGWTSSFNYVIGIVHTNYKEYASSQYHGLWSAPVIAVMSSAMVRAYCHKVIKLSDVLQTFAPEKESTSNTHGVRSDYLREGRRRAQHGGNRRGVYFIGKLLWAKGFDLMLELQDYYKQCTGEYFSIDIYGSGPDRKDIMRAYHGRKKVDANLDVASTASTTTTTKTTQIQEAAPSKTREYIVKIGKTIRETTEFDIPKTLYELRRTRIPASFPGRVDHSELKENYSVFVNPSVSEVLCTTTAEALAMGKFVIIPVHPSNTFFLRFPNCLGYRNKFEFVASLRWALSHDPEPLTPALAHEFTWEAATERFIQAASITFAEAKERERLGRTKMDERIAWFHNELGKGNRGDAIRKVLGAGPASQQVKYQQQRDSSDDDEDEEEEGLGGKFLGSSLAEAIRKTVANGLPSLKQLGGSTGNPTP